MSEIKELLERQEQWQRSRARLSWSEKLRLAKTLRNAALAMGGERKEPGRCAVHPGDADARDSRSTGSRTIP